MNFDDLKNWLETEIVQNDIVEIAGTGEPTLCGWLPELLEYLEKKKTSVILRTNGLKLDSWRLALCNLLVILSKHDSSDDYIREKCKYLLPCDLIACLKDKINKEEIPKIKDDIFSKHKSHPIQRAFFVTPDGKIRYMPCMTNDMGTVWDYKPKYPICATFETCVFVLGAYNFIEYLKSPFELPKGIDHIQVKTLKEIE